MVDCPRGSRAAGRGRARSRDGTRGLARASRTARWSCRRRCARSCRRTSPGGIPTARRWRRGRALAPGRRAYRGSASARAPARSAAASTAALARASGEAGSRRAARVESRRCQPSGRFRCCWSACLAARMRGRACSDATPAERPARPGGRARIETALHAEHEQLIERRARSACSVTVTAMPMRSASA